MSNHTLPADPLQHVTLTVLSDLEEKVLVRQKALATITNRIRRSLDFSIICETATEEIRHLLAADRVAIYRFNSDWSGRFICESAAPEWIELIEAQNDNALINKNVSACSIRLLETTHTADTHLQVTYGGSFVQGEVFRVCTDIYNAGFSDCYIEVLESYQARSYSIIAIYLDHQLWGLLAAYQNSGPRHWQEDEVQLLIQVAEQLGIALKQAEYVRTIQTQSAELKQAIQVLHQSQAQLVQSEKMVSLGRLVAGIAHEINNPINFIYANLDHVKNYVTDLLILAELEQQHGSLADFVNSEAIQEQAHKIDIAFILEDLPKTLISMEKGANRIRDIILSLRNFSRLDESRIKKVNLHEGIESTLLILNHRLAADSHHPPIEVIKDYGDLPLLECQPAQVNQVILNLLNNAVDSLDEAWRIDQLGDKSPEPSLLPQLKISTQMNEHGQAEMRIRDNGIGIEKGNQSKVFDYFFTTKPVGQGNGLGLAICKQIIEDNHGGTLSVNTDLAQGVEFLTCLPICLSLQLLG